VTLEGSLRRVLRFLRPFTPCPDALQGAIQTWVMIMPIYRAWVISASLVKRGGTWSGGADQPRIYAARDTENAKLMRHSGQRAVAVRGDYAAAWRLAARSPA